MAPPIVALTAQRAAIAAQPRTAFFALRRSAAAAANHRRAIPAAQPQPCIQAVTRCAARQRAADSDAADAQSQHGEHSDDGSSRL